MLIVGRHLTCVWAVCLTAGIALLAGPTRCAGEVNADLAAAYQLIQQGDSEGALAAYQTILDGNPPLDARCECLFWMGTVQEHIKQGDKAISSFEAVAALDPDYRWPQILHRLATRYLDKGDRAKADSLIQDLRSRRASTTSVKDRTRADLLIADWYKAVEDWPKAMEYYQSILGKYPDYDRDVLFAVGDTAGRAGKYDVAARALQEYIEKYPEGPQFELAATKLITAVASSNGDWNKALEKFEAIRAEHPGRVEEVLFNLGMSAHSAGKYAIAIQALDGYTSQYPDNQRFAEAAWRLVEDYTNESRFAEALAFLSRISLSHPKLRTHGTVLRAGLMVEGLNDVEASIELAQSVIDENTDPYEVFLAKNQMGFNYLYLRRDAKKAREFFTQALNAYPKDNLAIEIASDIAASYNLEGKHAEAARLYAEALEKYPCLVDDIAAHVRYMIGDSSAAAGDRSAAKNAWAELAAKHPDSEWTKIAERKQARWEK